MIPESAAALRPAERAEDARAMAPGARVPAGAEPIGVTAARRRRAKLVFLAVLAFTMLGVTRPIDTSDNLGARMSTTFAIVERGKLNIGPYLGIMPTHDWSYHDGRYFSNKAPGPALMAVPLYALQRSAQPLFGIEDRSLRSYRIAGWIANAFLGVLPTLMGLLLLWRLFERRYGFTTRGAFGMTALAGVSSLSLPYATMLFGHQTAAAFLTIGIALTLLEATERERARPLPIGLAGLCFGLAVLADHLAAIGVIAWSLWLVLEFRDQPRTWLWWALGGAGPAVTLAAFNFAAFDSPWIGSYSGAVLNPRFAEAVLFHAPSLEKLAQLTLAPARGWFYATPVFAGVVAGVVMAPRLRRRWPELIIAGLAVCTGLLVLSSWNSWHGGAAVGPRYLLWAMPFAVLLLVPVARRFSRAVVVLAQISAVLMLAVTVTDILVPLSPAADPYLQLALPVLLGQRAPASVSIWGWLGAPVVLAFTLFLAIWIVAGVWIDRQLRPEPAAELEAT
jgi:hypothetical protein